MAWLRICVQRFSGFLSFWKSCCNSFLTCKHEVKVQSEALDLIKWTITFFPIASIKSFSRIRCCKRISSGTSAKTLSTDSFWPSMSWSCTAYWVKYFSTTASDSLLKRGSSVLKTQHAELAKHNPHNSRKLCNYIRLMIWAVISPNERMNWICQNNFLHRLFTSLKNNIKQHQVSITKL